MTWMKPIIIKYFKEIRNEKPSDEDIEYRADKLVKDLQRTLNARKDFQKGGKA